MKRFIRYLYEYEQGKKAPECGLCKGGAGSGGLCAPYPWEGPESGRGKSPEIVPVFRRGWGMCRNMGRGMQRM